MWSFLGPNPAWVYLFKLSQHSFETPAASQVLNPNSCADGRSPHSPRRGSSNHWNNFQSKPTSPKILWISKTHSRVKAQPESMGWDPGDGKEGREVMCPPLAAVTDG